MKIHNGIDYFHNYDLFFKWLGPELKGRTLDALGIKTGVIKNVFGFEPADIKVTAGRLDLLLENVEKRYFHIEAHRNLRKNNMYQFAAYHFFSAKVYGDDITSIIITSGDVSIKETAIETKSGKYSPVIIDLSKRNWEKRLDEIRAAVKAGTFKDWFELPFLSIYGKETGKKRSEMIENILRFEKEMYDQGKISQNLLVATFLMSNKLIDKKYLRTLWEEFKMLDIIEITREKVREEVKEEIEKAAAKVADAEAKVTNAEAKVTNAEAKVTNAEAKVTNAEAKAADAEAKVANAVAEAESKAVRGIVIEILVERFNVINTSLLDQLKKIRDLALIRAIYRLANRCKTIQEFEISINQMV